MVSITGMPVSNFPESGISGFLFRTGGVKSTGILSGDDNPLADAIMDRIAYNSYKINIESSDPSRDISMREVYGLDPAKAK